MPKSRGAGTRGEGRRPGDAGEQLAAPAVVPALLSQTRGRSRPGARTRGQAGRWRAKNPPRNATDTRPARGVVVPAVTVRTCLSIAGRNRHRRSVASWTRAPCAAGTRVRAACHSRGSGQERPPGFSVLVGDTGQRSPFLPAGHWGMERNAPCLAHTQRSVNVCC